MKFKITTIQKLDKGDPIKGIGDLAALALKPPVWLLEKLKIDLANCKGCEDRKEWLNKFLPL